MIEIIVCISYHNQIKKLIGLSFLSIIFNLATITTVASQDLGNGFFDHGVGSPNSNHRGIVATIDANGRNVALVWLFDHRGGYALLMIDAETGKSEQFPMPFPAGDAVYSSILSSKNKFYTLFNNHFAEFDPVKRAFTFEKEAMPTNTMAMTEDDNGIIWAVTYPNSGLVSFNPITREFRDFGYLYKQNWLQYPRYIATDDAGWVYFGLGSTASQIISFDPDTRLAKPVLNEAERKRGYGYVYRDLNGKVYGQSQLENKEKEWYELYKGNANKIVKHDLQNPKTFISGSQGLFHREFPDGKKIKELDLLERKIVVEDPKTNTEKTVDFDYSSDGALIMGVGTSPNGTIAGGTAFPMRFCNYKPKTGKIINVEAYDQFNALARQGNRFYFAAYPTGSLLEWDPSKPWIKTKEGEKTNPLLLADESLYIHRPHRLLAYTDGKTIIMSGTPQYGYTGGGLLFWDRKKKTSVSLQDSAVILDQSTMSMVALPGGKFLGGTTTSPGTGGEKKAKEAVLYVMDLATKRVEWSEALLHGTQTYSDLFLGPDGLVYGIADLKKFFVFDPVKCLIVYQQDAETSFGRTVSYQSPRIFVSGPNREIYLIFARCIVRVERGSFKLIMVAESPVTINAGGDYLDGRIYFVSGSHICSYKLK
jgi:hypothetical protein